MLQQGVDAKNAVVWFNNGSRDLRARPDGERNLGLLSVVD
jgi:hypothetical protein